MKGLILVSMVLLMATVGAVDQKYELHVLVSGNDTFVWTDYMSPLKCNTKCDIEVPKCNESECEEDMFEQINATRDLVRWYGVDINSTVTEIDGKVLTTVKASELLNVLKTDLISALGTRVDSQGSTLKLLLTNSTKEHDLEMQLLNKTNEANLANNNYMNAISDLGTCREEQSNMDYVLMFAVIVIFALVMSLINGWSLLRRNVGV